MPLTSPDPADLVNADVLETFMEFPAPLALLDADGRLERVNSRFTDRLDVHNLDAGKLRALAQDPNGQWQDVRLSLAQAEVRVRAVRTSHRILLIVDDPGSAGPRGELDALRARIGDLERDAATDHLTGAWNRAHFDRVIASELARSQASRLPLSLILFDIDHFKDINDRFGHAVGDLMLCELVRLVRSHMRSADVLFRWGGEEFVVLVASAGHRHAESVAENLRKVVAGHAFEGAGAMTISLGVAEHDGDEDVATWFRRLDAALYDAKRSGRNRVIVAARGNSDAWSVERGASVLNLVWQEGYECGESTIDAEHRELFRLANNLIDASIGQPPQPIAIRAALDEFIEHVRRHFADEEAILEKLHYPQLDEHRRAHAGLVRRALAMADRLDIGEVKPGAIVEFLAQDVVARHLMTVDRAFFPLFRKASIAPTPP